jgi:hypothetical protein
MLPLGMLLEHLHWCSLCDQTMLQQIIFFEIFIFSELHHLQSRLQNFQTLLPNLNFFQLTLVSYIRRFTTDFRIIGSILVHKYQKFKVI